MIELRLHRRKTNFRWVFGQSLCLGMLRLIADGNRRWAREKGLSASAGHEAGVLLLRQLIELCCRWGIKVLTVFIFSCDNWSRSKVEINFMMSLFERLIFSESEVEKFSREDIRMSVIGDTSKLPKPLQGLINNAEETTKYNSGLQLILALN
ncbi:Alkyl transferase [Quillaja saponaria]|uniref:Alkyl transferase n=1 Tax=Quillaja saponaria TaxID=32244 RepID=A0AAD7LMM9_QUISA|nr:Alkyl transferase [Quillaja saponaria]